MVKIFIDLDDTVANYTKRFNELKTNDIKFPQSQYGFYTSLETIEDSIEVVNWLRENFDVYILTRPSYLNPLSYTEKRIWVEKVFDLEFCKKLILCYDKSLILGDYLIDDHHHNFVGKEIIYGSEEFKNWKLIKNFFEKFIN